MNSLTQQRQNQILKKTYYITYRYIRLNINNKR